MAQRKIIITCFISSYHYDKKALTFTPQVSIVCNNATVRIIQTSIGFKIRNYNKNVFTVQNIEFKPTRNYN